MERRKASSKTTDQYPSPKKMVVRGEWVHVHGFLLSFTSFCFSYVFYCLNHVFFSLSFFLSFLPSPFMVVGVEGSSIQALPTKPNHKLKSTRTVRRRFPCERDDSLETSKCSDDRRLPTVIEEQEDKWRSKNGNHLTTSSRLSSGARTIISSKIMCLLLLRFLSDLGPQV